MYTCIHNVPFHLSTNTDLSTNNILTYPLTTYYPSADASFTSETAPSRPST